MKQYKTCFITAILILFALVLRIYQITVLPLSMHIDEAGLGLNAWSIAHFGTDRYGNFLPICPSNFYGEQSAFYTYFCALCIKLGGLNMFTLRFPAVFMGMVTVIFGALIMKEIWGSKGFYTGFLLLSIFPYFIMNCRFALDCNAMLGAVTVSLYVLIRLIQKIRKHPEGTYYGHFALLGISLGFVLYTYIIAAIVISLFSLSFGIYYFLYKRERRTARFKQLLFWAIPLVIMVIPLLLTVLVHVLDLEAIVTPFFSIPKMHTNRAEEIVFSISSIGAKLKNLLYPLTYDGKYGSSQHYWTMYWWSVPFILLGGIASIYHTIRDIKAGHLSIHFMMLLFSAAEIIMFLLCGLYNYHINGIFIALAFFCLNGIFLAENQLRKKSLKATYTILLVCLYSGTFLGFTAEYFHPDNSENYQVFGGVDQALRLLDASQSEKEIYVIGEVGEIYFLSNPIPPAEFASHCDELGFIKDYKNLHFYNPASYDQADILVCNKTSGWRNVIMDNEQTGYKYTCLEGDYYCLFIKSEEP